MVKDYVAEYTQRLEEEYEQKKQYPKEDHYRETLSKLTGGNYRMLDHPPTPRPSSQEESFLRWSSSSPSQYSNDSPHKSRGIDEAVSGSKGKGKAPRRSDPRSPPRLPTRPTRPARPTANFSKPLPAQPYCPEPNPHGARSPYEAADRPEARNNARGIANAEASQVSTRNSGNSSETPSESSKPRSPTSRLDKALQSLKKSNERLRRSNNPRHRIDALLGNQNGPPGWM